MPTVLSLGGGVGMEDGGGGTAQEFRELVLWMVQSLTGRPTSTEGLWEVNRLLYFSAYLQKCPGELSPAPWVHTEILRKDLNSR